MHVAHHEIYKFELHAGLHQSLMCLCWLPACAQRLPYQRREVYSARPTFSINYSWNIKIKATDF
jgi:hypothetical protein